MKATVQPTPLPARQTQRGSSGGRRELIPMPHGPACDLAADPDEHVAQQHRVGQRRVRVASPRAARPLLLPHLDQHA